jgi:hypothetical protein
MSASCSQGALVLPAELRLERIDVVVKRTFIDLQISPNNSAVRRASLPASLDRISCNRDSEKSVGSRKGSISDVSTEMQMEDEYMDECEYQATATLDMYSDEAPPQPYAPRPQILSTTFHPSQLEVQPVNIVDPSHQVNWQSMGQSVLDNSVSSHSPAPVVQAAYDSQWQYPSGTSVMQSSSSPQRPQARTALSAKAQPWQPNPPAHNSRFYKQAADVMAKLEVSLLSSAWDVDVVIKKEASNFTISVSMREDEAENWALVKSEAQEVLLRAAKESSCVYVLGCERDPFQQLGNGFSATLAEMRDESDAHPHSLAYVVLQLVD